ncbi:ABC transporter permease [Prochlorococcus sp. AH-736-B04]|nr:ABC transporter permease [Prochlorococcus sp. AH-736-B04]
MFLKVILNDFKNKGFYNYILRVKRGLRIQINVMRALTYREFIGRASLVKFGYIGILIEPLGVMAIFLTIFAVIRRRGGNEDLGVLLFLICGIVIFTLFQAIAIRSMNSMDANSSLFFYRQVHPIDTIFSRTIVEIVIYSVVFIILVTIAFLTKQSFFISDFALAITSMGLGIFLMIATYRYEWVKSIVQFLMRPIWFLSGVFFSLNDIPQNIRPYLSWNPILQSIELLRHSFANSYPLSEEISLTYLIQSTLVVLTISLWLYDKNGRILRTK